MTRLFLIFILGCCISFPLCGQGLDSLGNTATQLINSKGKLNIGGYAGIHYNQPIDDQIRQNGNLDVHRLVMLFGYNFDSKLSFVTEIEFEHVKEVFVEQAFVNYRVTPGINFRGGLLLIPMGIVNEFHEPTTFFGVERPTLDKFIVPSTWREIGLGLQGTIIDASLNYQLYMVNGFLSYNGEGRLSGASGLRGGRQKGAEAIVTSPNFTGKISYFGLRGLNVGFSFYAGNSQTSLYDELDVSDQMALAQADSSRVNTSMLGVDLRYTYKALKVRGQYNFVALGNTSEYNAFTSSNLGKKMNGFYLEAAYNLLRGTDSKSQLYPFVRIERLNTHAKVEGDLNRDLAFDRRTITTGIDWIFNNGVAFKADYQFLSNEAGEKTNQFNLGIGIWFR